MKLAIATNSTPLGRFHAAIVPSVNALLALEFPHRFLMAAGVGKLIMRTWVPPAERTALIDDLTAVRNDLSEDMQTAVALTTIIDEAISFVQSQPEKRIDIEHGVPYHDALRMTLDDIFEDGPRERCFEAAGILFAAQSIFIPPAERQQILTAVDGLQEHTKGLASGELLHQQLPLVKTAISKMPDKLPLHPVDSASETKGPMAETLARHPLAGGATVARDQAVGAA